MAITIQVHRDHGVQEYQVEVVEQQTVLDALFYIQNEIDPSLAFRCSCRVGMCGTCGMVINGKEGLACRTSLYRLGKVVSIEPLRHLPVVKDLVVDMDRFLSKYQAVEPYLKPRPEVNRPVVLPPHSGLREDIDLGLECISCGLCVSACDVLDLVPEFLGPAALNRAYNLVADIRDNHDQERLSIVGRERIGVWQCHTHMSCVQVCPKNIAPTRAIAHLKRRLIKQTIRGRRVRGVPRMQPILKGGS